jgi:CheY-like chemotaxis protein
MLHSSDSLPPVFVVDNEPDDLFLIQRALGLACINSPLVGFLSTEDLIRQLEHSTDDDKPRAIISDINMPGIDGFGLLAWIRQHPELARLPVAFMSTSDRPEDRTQARALGANAYFVKYPTPAEISLFFAAITDDSPSDTRELDETRREVRGSNARAKRLI